ncbi:terminase small subunit [Heyndrickxia oleronia]|uniref:Terminase small subunit n=1 Tax=Heyndrickxia oleronia TaxID=38875 RepID=A0AAW6SQ58_9BACI|nr:terminase small subunit [Heyndrickxia oleronia]MDH5160353.1 terminase small subunit [Heyndrickxia oleronia]
MAEKYVHAEKDYVKGMKYKDIAEKYDVSLNTVKSWKKRYGWNRSKGAPKEKSVHTKRKVAQPVSDDDNTQEVTLNNFLEDSDLTEKQRLFCLYYVRSFNATQSAIKAGYSPATAHVQGPRLLGNVRVREEIKRIKQYMTNELFIEAMDVLNKYIKIAFSDITDYLTFGQREVQVMGAFGPVEDENGYPVMKEVNYVDFKESGIVDGTIISEVKQGKDGVSIKLEDRMKALDKLALYFDLFPDKFKRQIEEEKLKIAHHKVFGGDDNEEYEDDGFEDALNATTSEVWTDVNNTTDEDS